MHAPGQPETRKIPALERYFEVSLYFLLLTSVLTLVCTGKLDPVTALAAPLALLWKGYRWARGCGPELSTRTATWLVGGYFVFFPLDLWWISRMIAGGTQNPALYSALLAAIHLMLFAMVIRLFSARTTRDYLFLAMLAFSAVLAAAILTVDTLFLGFFLVFLVLCVSTFMGLEMRRSSEAALASPAIPSGTREARDLQSALSLTAGAVALAALILGAGLFFIIPRFSAGYFSGFNDQPSLISGFTDDVELGQIGRIKRSSAVVMRIEVQGSPTAAHNVHWRGIALTNFDGRRWFTPSHDSIAVSEGPDGWLQLDSISPEMRRYFTPLHYTVLLEPIATDSIFVAADAARIRGQFINNGPEAGHFMRRAYLEVDKTGSISNPFHNFSDIRYEAVSELPHYPEDLLRKAPDRYPDSIRDVYLQLPRLDPRIPALAHQIAARSANPYDKARAIELYLRSHYAYTLDLTGPAPADPLAYFLFQKRAGHCEYFAAAMTVMLRTLGIPARYVNGFLPGEYNDVAGDFIVRARDAHSWVEVYFPGYGWLTFDPTPPTVDRATGLLSQLGLYWDWFELQWGEWVNNYDFFHQYTLAQNLRRTSKDWDRSFREKIDGFRNTATTGLDRWQDRLKTGPLWPIFPIAIFLGLAILFRDPSVRERLALFWQLRARNGALPPHTASLCYARMLGLLEERGWRKAPEQTALEFAASLPSAEVAGPVALLTGMYLAARFGGRGADPAEVRALLTRIRAALAAAGRPR